MDLGFVGVYIPLRGEACATAKRIGPHSRRCRVIRECSCFQGIESVYLFLYILGKVSLFSLSPLKDHLDDDGLQRMKGRTRVSRNTHWQARWDQTRPNCGVTRGSPWTNHFMDLSSGPDHHQFPNLSYHTYHFPPVVHFRYGCGRGFCQSIAAHDGTY